MKKQSLLFFLLCLLFVGCTDTDVPLNGHIETTEEGSSTFILKGFEDASSGFNVFQPDGFDHPFYIQDKKFVGSAWRFVVAGNGALVDMGQTPADEEWQETAEIMEGRKYWARYKGMTEYVFVKLRVAYIEENNVAIEYITAGTEERDLSENLNANIVIDGNTSLTTLQMPYYTGEDYFADYYVTVDNRQILNFSLLWSAAKKHAVWVAFSFDQLTSQDLVDRTNKWEQVDPNLPEDVQVNESMHKNDGFDKGHLCASEDRVYSKEANEQTFYYSNISPQLNDLNAGFWQKLEDQVRRWGRSVPDKYDEVYVTKGGTINDLLINFTGTPVYTPPQTPKTDKNGFTVNGLACPKYYFMAILAKKGDTYKSIGFLVEHKEGLSKNPTSSEIQACIVSIDELEKHTGLDFFCNLPDVIEDEVECGYNVSDWAW